MNLADEQIIKDLENVRYDLISSKNKAVIDDAIDTLQRQKAEIERLKKELNTDVVYVRGRHGKNQLVNKIFRMRVDAIRAEAIKVKRNGL